MKKLVYKSILFAVFSICLACEGNRVGEGFVVNQKTFQPIDSVCIEVLSGDDKIYSDSTGYYYVSNPFGKCIPNCTDIRIKYSKSGYQTFVRNNPVDGEVIFLNPNN